MIESIKCIKNLGPFKAVQEVELGQVTLMFAENGRGKTMLSEMFRSLATGASELVEGRTRLGSDQTPVVVLGMSDGETVYWTKEGWKTNGELLPRVSVYNDGFVDANVYSGLEVSAAQRQGLHGVVVGEEGVRKSQEYNDAVKNATDALKCVEQCRRDIVTAVDGLSDPGVDTFVNEESPADVDKQIQANDWEISLAEKDTQIKKREPLSAVVLPKQCLDEVRAILDLGISDVASDATVRVKTHISGLWDNGEAWVNEGWKHASTAKNCPYCGRPLHDLPLVSDYGSYFLGAYTDHKKAILDFQSKFEKANNEESRQQFVEDANKTEALQREWSNDGLEVKVDLAFRAGDAVGHWREIAAGISRALSAKSAAPLEPVAIDTETERALTQLEKCRQHIVDENQRMTQMNESIALLKESVASSNLDELRKKEAHLDRLKTRGYSQIDDLCIKYKRSCAARRDAERKRDYLKEELDTYRERIFEEYATQVNNYLGQFGTGFTIGRLAGNFTSGRVSSEFSIVIDDDEAVRLGGNETASPRKFKNTLSAGDRTSLSLAFFFACLDKQNDLGERIAVIDDPLSSLDHGRRHRTIEAIRQVASRASQVVILSHDTRFLKELYDSNKLPPLTTRLVRKPERTEFADWDIQEDCREETEARVIRMEQFLKGGTGDPLLLRQDIRLLLEAYLRMAFADHFVRTWRIGDFVGECENQLEAGEPILEPKRLEELKILLSYANPPHHPAAPPLNEDDLTTQVEAALRFCRGAPV